MAYDKIIPIRRRLDHRLAYAMNGHKTRLDAAPSEGRAFLLPEGTPSSRFRQGRKMLTHFPRADRSENRPGLDVRGSPPFSAAKGNTRSKAVARRSFPA